MLRDQESLRVSQAAEELGVARSPAHRLPAMLVYRGFAIRDEARGYLPGPSLSTPASPPWLPSGNCAGHCDRMGKTVNFVMRGGTQTRFLATMESHHVLHVGDRQHTILPARLSSGGQALLAELYLAGDPAGRTGGTPPELRPCLRRWEASPAP
ncbi:helix-turn-helix domain-containing protein [Nonomuraea polychroma]|uniref:helix-turn-helix domain-containing protein n=1 Tax=Nonomuraea polychroma TaxID=46176 RepID=UPI003D921404